MDCKSGQPIRTADVANSRLQRKLEPELTARGDDDGDDTDKSDDGDEGSYMKFGWPLR